LSSAPQQAAGQQAPVSPVNLPPQVYDEARMDFLLRYQYYSSQKGRPKRGRTKYDDSALPLYGREEWPADQYPYEESKKLLQIKSE
jgi:hypothetical protein